jgi:hypothetical protein
MTLNDFRQSLTATEQPAGLTHALAGLGGMARVIGRGRTNPLSRTKASRVRGYTPTCIGRKAIRTTQPIGTVGLENPFAGSHSMRNGPALLELCWDKVGSCFLVRNVIADAPSIITAFREIAKNAGLSLNEVTSPHHS